MENSKIALLKLYDLLKEYTDEEHILSRNELCSLLEKIHQIPLDRHTFCSYINTLIEFGIDISTYNDNNIGYFLVDREFEKSEIHLLSNAVYASHFIPEKDSKNLIKKLLNTQSKYFQKEFSDNIYVRNYNKTLNKEFFYNVEILLDAIKNKKMVTMQYMKYDIQKQLIPRKDHLFTLHPYHIIYANENYYLICRNDAFKGLSHYRIDKMKDIKTIDSDYDKLAQSFDPYDYAKTKIYMYSDQDERITLKCNYTMLDNIIDKFGSNVTLQPCDSEHFFAVLKASPEGISYYILQYVKYCEVLEPISLRNEISSILEEALTKKYEKRNS